jgi:hypothetical protein
MNRSNQPATDRNRPGLIRTVTRRLLDLLATAIGNPIPSRHDTSAAPTPGWQAKNAALVRAIAATPHRGPGLRVWLFADAIRSDNRWVCVLEDQRTVYVVEVHAGTGQTRLIALAPTRHSVGDGTYHGHRGLAATSRIRDVVTLRCRWPAAPTDLDARLPAAIHPAYHTDDDTAADPPTC